MKKNNIIILAIVLCFFAFASCTTSTQQKTSESVIPKKTILSEHTATASETALLIKKDLGITVDQLKENWNKTIKDVNFQDTYDYFLIDDFKAQKTLNEDKDESAFSYTFILGLSIQGIKYEDGKVKEAWIESDSDSFDKNPEIHTLAYGVFIATIDSNLSPDQRGDILSDDLNFKNYVFIQEPGEYTDSTYKLSLEYYKVINAVRLTATAI